MIRAKTWTRHDGTVYEKGDVFSAGEGDEKRLVALGAAEYVRSSEMEKPHNQKPDDPEDLEEEYRQLGGRPQADWPLEKLMDMLEERRGE